MSDLEKKLTEKKEHLEAKVAERDRQGEAFAGDADGARGGVDCDWVCGPGDGVVCGVRVVLDDG